MAELATECADCAGKGILQRAEDEDHRKWLEVFERLCDRYGGTGKLISPNPALKTLDARRRQCTGPSGVVFASCLTAPMTRRQTATPAASPTSQSSSSRLALSTSASSP